jgi:hypothetical protein
MLNYLSVCFISKKKIFSMLQVAKFACDVVDDFVTKIVVSCGQRYPG